MSVDHLSRGEPASSVRRPSRAAVALALGTIYLLWGATFLATRYAVAELPPLVTVAIRCTGGALLLYGWLWARDASVRLTRDQWRTAIIASVLLFLGCQGLIASSQRRVPSGQAAIIMTSIPLWMVLAESVRARRAPSRRALIAMGLGSLGVAVLTVGDAWVAGVGDVVALAVSALCWATGSLVARGGKHPPDPVVATAAMLAAGAGWTSIAAVIMGEPARAHFTTLTIRATSGMAFLVVCSTVLAFVAYAWLLRNTSAVAAASYAYVNPIVALLLGWIVGDERITPSTGLALLLVVGAVAASRGIDAPPSAEAAESPQLSTSHSSAS